MSKKQFLIAVDLDGTLLTDEDKAITPRTKKALHQAMDQGHKVVIATGRPFRASEMYYKELGLNMPIINFNGALVHHPQDTSWGTYHFPLNLSTAQSVVETSETFGVQNIMVEVMDHVFIRKHDDMIIDTFFGPDTEVSLLKDTLHTDPTSVLIYPYEHNVDELRRRLDQQHAEVIEHRKWGAPWNVIEVIRRGLNKAVGLERICHHYNIPVENVIAFGDEDNDFEMIEFAGTGVAMENAIPELKRRANAITLTNEEEGIADFLEKNVL
ncbi:Cof-type HAD-IIB family hydrolase [Caldalkalibacillus salinus]|uniref:Cof-type HAD-IIB family hydrolase n=1 Tax=Caldalkalibacillus salinus TaxID=2803787 RepID=UPI001921B87C|nr:Cof-type HAD-IIB family hydrolase [Caldalkalibacillus salinus]